MQGRQRGRNRARTWGRPTGSKAETQSSPGVSCQVRRSHVRGIRRHRTSEGVSGGDNDRVRELHFFFFFEGAREREAERKRGGAERI